MNLSVVIAVIMSLSIEMARSTKWKFNRQSVLKGDTCLSEDGSSYRGTVSWSKSGRRCLHWGRYISIWGTSSGIGSHNFCRNPDSSSMPWCRVRIGTNIVKEYCEIPKCSTPTLKTPVVQPKDTELTCGQASEHRQFKIVGGSFTPIESQPWVAAILNRRGDLLCGGSLIAPCWVLTAAHCFEGNFTSSLKCDSLNKAEMLDQNTSHFTVYLGKKATNETNTSKEQKFMVEKMIINRRYNSTNYNHDIALLKIKNKDGECAVKTAATRTVCLPPFRTQLPDSYQCSVAGYGRENEHAWTYSNVLKEGRVNLLSQSECRKKNFYGDSITGNMLCAANPNWSTDSCKGDSGGPLVCEVGGRMFLFGVVSWGDGCAQKNKPGVYTRVTNYNKWIAKNTGLPQYTAGKMYPTK
ncbi:hypothetical protein WMY93_007184 [Mugilogobius chulae]|uniref:trypsin n=1 Tax=Mugilogobius chulae TaxID=88201 RepID=A0AAW0PXH9_9GOBI